MSRVHLLIIDPQNDFCDSGGALYVPGAEQDMRRLAALVDRLGDRIDGMDISLDSHHRLDIAHAIWWQDANGRSPESFTQITAADVREGVWRTTDPSRQARSLEYLEALERGGRYPHVIWPEHCLVGTTGHCVFPELRDAISRWEEQRRSPCFRWKGDNPWTEHFSALRAEIPDPDDASTDLDETLMTRLVDAEVVLVAGEARSHCVANTVRDIVRLEPSLAPRVVLLSDAMSDVSGFEEYGRGFFADMAAMGVGVSTTSTLSM